MTDSEDRGGETEQRDRQDVPGAGERHRQRQGRANQSRAQPRRRPGDGDEDRRARRGCEELGAEQSGAGRRPGVQQGQASTGLR
ncbi:hypothetical protein [Micromonospora schwarzwaldensis]|uniref:hypothetical protein n=1 Tax=Micromonospora sp. DSM 45708 TaxID=3111767 RepID=UPI0031D17128